MKKVLVLFLLLIASQVVIAHEYHVGIIEMEFNKDSSSIEVSLKLNTQDLNAVLKKIYKEEIGLNAPEETSNSDSLLNDYLSNNISVSIDSVSKKYNYIGHEYEEEYCYIYIEFVDIKEVNQLYINCTILGEVGMSDHGHSHQSNLVNIKINGQLKSLYLNPHNREATIEFN